MTEPTFDTDGYPTKATLKAIRTWPYKDIDGLVAFLKKAWHYGPPYFRKSKTLLYLSTGGWSGNEDIIEALQKNTLVWFMYWIESRRGGHYMFKLTGWGKDAC